MSYKSTLQEHNSKLQQAIDKANALPDRSGGSAAVETCVGKVTCASLSPAEGILYYLDKELNFQTLEFNVKSGESVSFEVVKNSIIASADGGLGYTENLTPLGDYLTDGHPHYPAARVIGDFEMLVED